MSDKIEIIYTEFDEDNIALKTVTKLTYCEWRRNGRVEFSHNDNSAHAEFGDEQPSIPDDVRIAIALLVAPGLVCPVGEQKGEA